MRPQFLLIALALAVAAPPALADSTKIREVIVASARVRMGDIVSGLDQEIADIDLGPSPAAGGSRVIDREEIARALRDHNADSAPSIPAVVRIVRKTRRLEAAEIERIVRSGAGPKLNPGVTLSAVHPTRAVDIPDGWNKVTASIPRPPRRVGSVTSAASVVFYEDSQTLSMLSIPVELTLSQEATIPDVVHGARVTLIVRRGLVEITSAGTAGADGDVGSVIPIVLHPSGNTVLGRLEDKDHAIAADGP